MEERGGVPVWFWAVAAVAFVWEAMGCYVYLSTIGAADEVMPAWVSAAFAVAVWVGASGAILLAMRQRLARTAFAVSLLGAIVQLVGVLLVARAVGAGQPAALYAAVVVGLALTWFADRGIRRGWLR